MKKKIGEIYLVYQQMIQTKMTGMDSDKAWALIMFISDAKRICASYDSTREQALSSFRPDDWDEKLPKVQEAENPESKMDDDERKELLAYRDKFQNAVNEVLLKEWGKEVEIDDHGIDADALKGYCKANQFTVADAVSLVEFFGCVSPS